MSVSLLSRKTHIPQLRQSFVSRSGLLNRLLDAVHQPGQVVLLSGSAGFGKTTLLSELSHQTNLKVAWLSLDEGDNDLIQFWTYVVTAIENLDAEMGKSTMALLETPQFVLEENIPILLINDLDQLQQDLILVLDDFHVIQNPAIQKAVSFVVEHLPKRLRPIISTRVDPPWPLSRLRARNQLVEIRADDLRFSLEETTQFLNDVMKLNLSNDDIKLLGTRTEGWIASLQLAAISIKGKSDASGFIKTFAGSHTYIADYLVEEVLSQLCLPVKTFLFQTSILDRLSTGLCNAVTERQDSDVILRDLYHSNLFLLPLDDEGQWFRYHHLFADLLRARLHENVTRDSPAALHKRAAAWYELNGLAPEALQHFLAAKDYPNAARLLETIAMAFVMKAQFKTLEEWLKIIPGQYINECPRINIAFAWLYITRRAFERATPFLESLQRYFSSTDENQVAPALLGQWYALQSMLLNAQGKTMEARNLAERALQFLPFSETQVRSMVYMGLAEAYQQLFDWQQATATYEILIQTAHESGDLTSEILGTSLLGRMLLQQGKLHTTFQLVNKILQRIEQTRSFSPFSATLYGELAQVHYQWHQLDEARKNFRLSVEWSSLGGFSDAEIYHSVFLSRLFQMQGDYQSALIEIDKALALKRTAAPALVSEEVVAQQVSIYTALGRIMEVETVLAPFGFTFKDEFAYPALPAGGGITHPVGLLYNSALRVLLCKMKMHPGPRALRDGIDLADRLITTSLNHKIVPIALQTLLLRSQLHAIQSKHQQSTQDIAQAIALAESEGPISIFIEEGEPISQALESLCTSSLLTSSQKAHARKILLAFPQNEAAIQSPGAHDANTAERAQSLIDPLTPREMEVLRILAAGDSNREIADRLVITLSAVKKHTGNIFRKLDVNSRTQAIARAREIGLLV